jgi:hypothetical protein
MKICLLLLILIHLDVFSQAKQWPPDLWKDSTVQLHRSHSGSMISNRIFKGYLVLKNGDVLRGYIRLYGITNCTILETNKFDSTDVLYKNIDYIIGHIPSFKDSVEFRPLKCKPFRLVKSIGNVAIYDFFNDISDSVFAYPIFLQVNNKLIKICTYGADFFFRESEYYTSGQPIIKFINKRYHKQFKKNDFKDINSMLDYILDKENE